MNSPFAGLALQNFLLFVFAIMNFPWTEPPARHPERDRSQHSRAGSRRHLTAVAGVASADAASSHEPPLRGGIPRRLSFTSMTSRSMESVDRWAKLRNFFDFLWTYSVRLMLEYAYLISLIVIYVSCAVDDGTLQTNWETNLLIGLRATAS